VKFQKSLLLKSNFWLDRESYFGFSMDKRSSYVILFNSRRRIDLIAQILLFMI